MFGFALTRSITTDALAQRMHAPNTLLLDVREPIEYRAGHIAGAKNVPLRRIATYTPPTGKQMYVICHSGTRSKRAYKLLHQNGVEVINVRGGMMAWKGTVRR